MKRQPITERDEFSYDERLRINKKSDDRCCHCGKKVFPEYGATIDHYIPISKGGTNSEESNLIMLCHECNQVKGNKIIPPEDYIKYLHEEDFEKLSAYFDNYIQSFEYMGRRNLLSCDEYVIRVAPFIKGRIYDQRKINSYPMQEFLLTRATWDTLPETQEYFRRYLKKNQILVDEYTADKNIEFWYRFGCLYYVKQNDEIKVLFAVTIRDMSDDSKYKDIPKSVEIYIFPYYSNPKTSVLAGGVREKICHMLMKEQNIPFLTVIMTMPKNDGLTFSILTDDGKYEITEVSELFCSSYSLVGTRAALDDISAEDERRLKEFYKSFNDAEYRAWEWCNMPENEGTEWMISMLNQNYTPQAKDKTDNTDKTEVLIDEVLSTIIEGKERILTPT